MTFGQLAQGSAVFLDANILVYYFQPHPVHGPACQHLLQRIEQSQLTGFTSTHVLGEMAHRLMALEAVAVQGWTWGKITQRLRKQPAVLRSLTHFQTAVDSVLQSRIQVLSLQPVLLSTAMNLSRQHGLLVNDALMLAAMSQHGLTDLASNDADFDRVPGLSRYAPV
jgi:uncharacterized protein